MHSAGYSPGRGHLVVEHSGHRPPDGPSLVWRKATGTCRSSLHAVLCFGLREHPPTSGSQSGQPGRCEQCDRGTVGRLVAPPRGAAGAPGGAAATVTNSPQVQTPEILSPALRVQNALHCLLASGAAAAAGRLPSSEEGECRGCGRGQRRRETSRGREAGPARFRAHLGCSQSESALCFAAFKHFHECSAPTWPGHTFPDGSDQANSVFL